MAKISLSIGTLQIVYGDKAALKMARDAGFDGVDFNLVHYARHARYKTPVLPLFEYSDEEYEAYFKDIRAYADELGLKIALTHNLVDSYVPDDEEHNAFLKKAAIRSIKATALLGCEYTVVHCISTMQWGYEVDAKTMHRVNQEMYADLIPAAEEWGVKICMESFGRCRHNGVHGFDHFADPQLMLGEYEELKTGMKAFCMDTGHTNAATEAGYLSVPNMIRMFGSRIQALHLHDNNGFSDQHLIPGQGTVNWGETFKALQEIGYDGYYNYELNLAKLGPDYEILVPFLEKYLRNFTDRYLK
ncbi:MAG: sugar phosphate isomerase/epimerase [Clostridia bacterium]|nr:sugar phosphate isomerase/epimerase [Clostridia bacterium]